MDRIVIDDVKVVANRLECTYTVEGEWRKYFDSTNSFFAEYSKEIDMVPKSVAIVPFLCNVLPVAWIFDAEIILEEIDKDFFESIEDFKQGFVNMYPGLSFKGRITPKKVIDNRQEDLNKSAVFFSGGVDAYNTLISHIDEDPILVTLWGADIAFENKEGWELVNTYISEIADNSNLDYISIKTSFRRFLNEAGLNEYVTKRTGNNWWYGFQHGLGLIGHVAPVAYQYKIKTSYIASSLTMEENSTCASDPSIDNFIKFCGNQIIHDGFEQSRQDKVNQICEYVEKTGASVQLRVCWESDNGSNCCHCEKCYRTIFCLIARKSDPREYGFNYADEEFAKMMKDYRIEIHFQHPSYVVLFNITQKELRKNYTINQIDKCLKWFYKIKIEKELSLKKRLLYKILRKAKKVFIKSK